MSIHLYGIEFTTKTHGNVFVSIDSEMYTYSIISTNGHLISFNDSDNIIDLNIKLQKEIKQMDGKRIINGI